MRNAVHGPVEWPLLPMVRAGRAVLDRRHACRVDHQAERGSAFRTERASVHGRTGIAFDIDDLACLDVDQLAATDRAIGADSIDDRVRATGTRLEAPAVATQDRAVQGQLVKWLAISPRAQTLPNRPARQGVGG